MAVMTAQPALPLTPQNARPVGVAAAIIEDDDGGRVFVHGNLAYAWDAGDTAGRRFAAVSLMRIKAATQLEVAEGFAVRPATVRRWDAQHSDAGVAGLLPERKGPKRKSKLTVDTVAAIRRLRAGGASYRGVAAATGVSEGSVRNALKPAGADVDREEPCVPTGADDPLPQEQEQEQEEQEQEVDVEADPEVDIGPEPEVDLGAENDCPATASAVMAAPPVRVPVLANPVPRGRSGCWRGSD
jgi:transposase